MPRSRANLNSNVKYYSIGRLKNNEEHYSQFFEDYQLKFKIDTDYIYTKEEILLHPSFDKRYEQKFHYYLL